MTMAIGDPVSGAASGSVLFVDSNLELAQDNADFFYEYCANVLT
jgi:hypothetical protein